MKKSDNFDNCTLLVSTCDSYSDLWEPFFTVLRNEWPNLDYPIVLNTESKSFDFEGYDIKTFNIYKGGESVPWGKRLRETLKLITTDYIILMMDDVFLYDKVDSDRIKKCIGWMDKNKRISCFCFMQTFTPNKRSERYEGFEKRPLVAEYKFNGQVALWRRERLIRYLRDNESGWEWETYGNWRSYRYLTHEFYSQVASGTHVFPYLYEVGGITWGGLAIYRGKWYVPAVDHIFKKNGISVDYSVRGTIDESEFLPPKLKTKEDYKGIKRRLYWIRPVYVFLMKIVNIVRHAKHLV